ncbi:MAG: prepilin-type N-terminal cleavage/methylation domain-containing protein [Candidatus Methylomirabilis sp.]|nr:prepilin-type N-terminal cleavage/methylation domain-containing protein [Deltaproteobacteria bacterium]
MEARCSEAGFTLVEALIALAILAILFVPMVSAVGQAQRNTRAGIESTQVVLDAQARMDMLLAQSFSTLAVGSASYAVVTAFGYYPGTIVVATYDCSGDGAPDADCKQITVAAGGVSLVVLKADY